MSIVTEEVVRLGYDVTLFASADSKTAARLVRVVDGAPWHTDPPYPDMLAFTALTLGRPARELGSFDIVHNHLDYPALPLAGVARCRMVSMVWSR